MLRKSLLGPGLLGLVVAVHAYTPAAQADVTYTVTADAYAQSNGTTQSGSASSILLKRDTTAGSTNHRKSWIRFDGDMAAAIAARSGRGLTAEMDLHFVDSSLGALSGSPTETFHVYGVTDNTLDGWTEAGLTYANAPANNTADGNAVDVTKTTDVGSFSGSGKLIGVTEKLSTASLLSFLANDTNGKSTFALVRDTPAVSSTENYVHAIASRESGNGAKLILAEHRNRVTNGEFETSGGSFTTTGWSNFGSTAVAGPGLIAGSKQAAFFDSSKDGNLLQNVNLKHSNVEADMYFATTGGSPSGDDRGFNVNFDLDANSKINLRVNNAGQIQIYNDQGYAGVGSGWQTISALGTIDFSVDGDGNKSFSDGSGVGDVLNTYRIELITDGLGTSAPAYSVLLSDANGTMFTKMATGLKFFQSGVPTTSGRMGLTTLLFDTSHGTGNFTVDSVYVQSVPEPTTLALGAIAAAGLMIRRRRRA